MSQVQEFFSPAFGEYREVFDFQIDIGFFTVTGACRKIFTLLAENSINTAHLGSSWLKPIIIFHYFHAFVLSKAQS